MAQLPSYKEATTRPQWQVIVAPYVSVRDYASLCLVNRAFYDYFAPCLWKNPLEVLTIDKRDAYAVFNWLYNFVLRRARTVRHATRCLVLCLDLDGSWAIDWRFDSVTERYRRLIGALPAVFPCLRCLALDGSPAFDSTSFSRDSNFEAAVACVQHRPVMLSARRGRVTLSPAYLSSTYLQDLVVLDLSFNRGSLKHELGHAMLQHGSLPSLRVLKAQGRQMDDQTASSLVDAFHGQLWSLDLSNNRLTDRFLGHLSDFHLADRPVFASLRSDSHFDIEGKQVVAPGGNESYGRFIFIQESEHSGTFDHPERHLIESPLYTADGHDPLPGALGRHTGRKRARQDSCDGLRYFFLGATGEPAPSEHEMQQSEVIRRQGGITHLHLDGNNFSAQHVSKMFRQSSGQLEVFECDSTHLHIPTNRLPSWLPRTASLSGFIGNSHLFRPVLSVNLQVLRIHHSVVTHIPSLQAHGIPTRQCQWLAENSFGKRASMAYPQVFIPDTNPRLCSLTLTGVPQYSSGPLIKKLLDFLKLASVQEGAIQDAGMGSAYRRPVTVRGLRHLRIELALEPSEEVLSLEDFQELDAEELGSLDSTEFSFFGESGWVSSSTSPSTDAVRATTMRAMSMTLVDPAESATVLPSGFDGGPLYPDLRRQFPVDKTTSEYMLVTEEWKGEVLTIPVWIGSGIPGPHEAVNEYMRALNDRLLHRNVSPASPSQVLAGAPFGSYLFQAAWDALLVPPCMRKPTAEELNNMTSVVSAIKEYRKKTKAAQTEVQEKAGTSEVSLGEPHYHWTGTLELSFPTGT